MLKSGTTAVGQPDSERFGRIKKELLSTCVYLCPERACLVTDFFRRHDDPRKPMTVRKAEALSYILSKKSVRIYPDELIAGNTGSRRISALVQPELAGVFMGTELLSIDRRRTTPLQCSWQDRLKLLLGVFPYWLTRNMAFRAFMPDIGRLLRYVTDQLNARYYLINEAGGIGHFLPNYERMLNLGVKGYLDLFSDKVGPAYDAARIACEGVLRYAARLADEAERLAGEEKDPHRYLELKEIARICRKVPLESARTVHEALQSLWLTHMAVCLESLNSAISFGRIDQYLYPFYERDLAEGILTREGALELLLCFTAKCAEHVFLMSENLSQYHGGYLVVQAAVVGGMDRDGNDAVNDLSYLFLDVMEQAGLRDPNYQARLHRGSPEPFLRRACDVVKKGNGVPALFCDEACVKSLVAHGYPEEEARNYGVVGCVELALPGKSFFSTDAGLFNLPVCLELALNRGRRMKGGRHVGANTPNPEHFENIGQVIEAFRTQVGFMLGLMIGNLQVMEKGNALYHPTPFSSMLVDGCLEAGRDVSEGGALYNSSGIQGVGVADVADSLAALETVVFVQHRYSMSQVLKALKNNFDGYAVMRAELNRAPKFGNNEPLPDGYAGVVAGIFHAALAGHLNTRGGPYVPGYYTVTCHVAFGRHTAALPSGRRAGDPFAPGLGPCNGCDHLGPTAVMNSTASVDASLSPNGYALNLRFDPATVAGERGTDILMALTRGFFESGGMEVQFNVLDPQMLEDARRHPGKYPGLVVRVSGYCAYFDDLPDAAKGEIIARTRFTP